MLETPLYRLKCGANSYDWGKLGRDSAAARFAAATGSEIDANKPYAELWMGTHPSNPSLLVPDSIPLLTHLQTVSSLLGSRVTSTFGLDLPFLFKVLSIRKALSIQAHPDKQLAARLHAQDPKNYPDPNHKPEMAIAITAFDAFCGFRPLGEVREFVEGVPALRGLVGEIVAAEFIRAVTVGGGKKEGEEDVRRNKKALRMLYETMMTADPGRLATYAGQLITAAREKPETFPGQHGRTLAELVLRLNYQFPGDIGLFSVFVLNYVRLQPGEAIFLRANEPHAYLSGDIMECMAASDNVVRAGFTPKFKDVPNLIAMLTYSYAPIDDQKMVPVPYPGTKHTTLYDPPIEEFAVMRTALGKGEREVVAGIDGPSIVIATTGKGWIAVGKKRERVQEGWVFFVGATAEVVVEADEEQEGEFVLYRAFCEVK